MTGRPTALVTGASSGIGTALARELARRDHDLVLVARDEARLRALAAELAGRGGAEPQVLVADLTAPADLARVEERARTVDVLVNNAGFGTSGRLAELPVDAEDRQVRLNVLAVVRLTGAALPGMVARGRGGVLNVGSIAGFLPSAGTATYGATKAFVLSFSEAAHEETRGTGVTVTCLAPGFTRTEFQARADYDASKVPAALWQSAEEVARAGLDGLAAGRAVVVPGPLNKATVAGVGMLPRVLVRRVSGLFSSR